MCGQNETMVARRRMEIDPHLRQKVTIAKKETQGSLLDMSSRHPRTRLSLDQTNAEFVAAFLQGSPHIQGLSIVSNLERHDGAMEVMANTLRDTKNISILCLWGDCDEDDVN